MKAGKIERSLLNEELVKEQGECAVNPEVLAMENCPIITPQGELLIKEMSFRLERGMNCFLRGPNGCGKTSVFRILSKLWQLHGGKMETAAENLYFIPQTSYLPAGNLRDQIIYPDNEDEMHAKGVTDEDIKALLDSVELLWLEQRWGLEEPQPWKDIFSGGQRQRIAIARCFY